MNTRPDALHVGCVHCGATNRIPRSRLTEDPVCGRCGAALLAGEVASLGDADFDRVVAATQLPVLVDFWAPWCGPCRMMAPAFAQAATQLKGRALLVKVNSDDNPVLSSRYGIRSIPTLICLQESRELRRSAGALPVSSIVALATG